MKTLKIILTILAFFLMLGAWLFLTNVLLSIAIGPVPGISIDHPKQYFWWSFAMVVLSSCLYGASMYWALGPRDKQH